MLANACGPCIGLWKRHRSEEEEPNSIITSFNRNFAKRNDGNPNTHAFVASPEIVTAMVLGGRLDFNPLVDTLKTKEGKEFKCDVPGGHNSFVYLLAGDLSIGKNKHDKTSNSNLILLDRGDKLIVKANKKSEFLFIAGKPIGEPIARGGPFVMNTKAEILEAVKDYHNGTFAKY